MLVRGGPLGGFCSNCGERLEDDAAFCHNCGASSDGAPHVAATEGALLTRMVPVPPPASYLHPTQQEPPVRPVSNATALSALSACLVTLACCLVIFLAIFTVAMAFDYSAEVWGSQPDGVVLLAGVFMVTVFVMGILSAILSVKGISMEVALVGNSMVLATGVIEILNEALDTIVGIVVTVLGINSLALLLIGKGHFEGVKMEGVGLQTHPSANGYGLGGRGSRW